MFDESRHDYGNIFAFIAEHNWHSSISGKQLILNLYSFQGITNKNVVLARMFSTTRKYM